MNYRQSKRLTLDWTSLANQLVWEEAHAKVARARRNMNDAQDAYDRAREELEWLEKVR